MALGNVISRNEGYGISNDDGPNGLGNNTLMNNNSGNILQIRGNWMSVHPNACAPEPKQCQ
jgi:hypothetical protein